MASYDQKMVKKSAYWHKHGKHAKVDPFYIRNERRGVPRNTVWFATIQDALAAMRKRRGSA